ncbi:division/cell wall cluster transcriptional repressor MraZ [Sphingomonas flavalba]|uniref:division/cell wall cluster transcriptional repressor MraZ n=1 Tax=Sphingomonas flavalba TaxID=2559804 RepID=UPI00109DFFAB|nr:division/cell wall cluster transcriptional repressor MraZ [Sphingomonas flavalba]
MSDRQAYSGMAVTGIDAKGRAAIPAFLRAALDRNGAESRVIIAESANAPCLIGFDPAYLEANRAKYGSRADARLDAGEAVDTNIARLAFALNDIASYDSSGRFVLPPFPAMKAGLDKTGPVLFAGLGDTFEIWNPDLLEADANVHPAFKERALFCLSQWKKGGKG